MESPWYDLCGWLSIENQIFIYHGHLWQQVDWGGLFVFRQDMEKACRKKMNYKFTQFLMLCKTYRTAKDPQVNIYSNGEEELIAEVTWPKYKGGNTAEWLIKALDFVGAVRLQIWTLVWAGTPCTRARTHTPLQTYSKVMGSVTD